MSHTPGAWKYDDRQITKNDGGVICTAWWFGNKGTVEKTEAEANARLIAAAPEMKDDEIANAKDAEIIIECIHKGDFLSVKTFALRIMGRSVCGYEKATGKKWDELKEEPR